MTKKLNIALVTDVLPDTTFTAGQVLEKIIHRTPEVHFDLYWVNQSNLPAPTSLPANTVCVETVSFNMPALYQSKKGWLPTLFPVVVLRRVVRALLVRHRRWPMLRRLQGIRSLAGRGARAALMGWRLRTTIAARRYDAIWLVLQGERLAIAYTVLCFGFNKKIILQQWDPISWWLQNRNYGKKVSASVEWVTRRLERRAHVNLVPSFVWQNMMKDRGLRVIRIDNFFSGASLEEKPFLRVTNDAHLNAVFIGQTYALEELQQILRALQPAAVRLGRKIVLHYFGSLPLSLDENGVAVVNHPYLDRDVLISRIRKFDLALLPYPTDPKFTETSRLSFPSKSKLYLAAGLPILSLCHADSSPQLFYKKYYSDYYFNMLESEGLVAYIGKVINMTSAGIKTRTTLANRILNEHFSERAELGPLHDMLEGLRQ